jgi:hypothetical protein
MTPLAGSLGITVTGMCKNKIILKCALNAIFYEGILLDFKYWEALILYLSTLMFYVTLKVKVEF